MKLSFKLDQLGYAMQRKPLLIDPEIISLDQGRQVNNLTNIAMKTHEAT